MAEKVNFLAVTVGQIDLHLGSLHPAAIRKSGGRLLENSEGGTSIRHNC